MTKLLLDTGVAAAFIHNRHGVFERVSQSIAVGTRIGLGAPVLAELIFGIEASQSRERNWQRLKVALPVFTIWSLDETAARANGPIAAELRKTGRAMQQIDIMIAAIAMSIGQCRVATFDSDLLAISGLAAEIWGSP